MKAILHIMKAGFRAVYAVLKLFPVQHNKILFLSRQTNGPGLDFRMLQEELRRQAAGGWQTQATHPEDLSEVPEGSAAEAEAAGETAAEGLGKTAEPLPSEVSQIRGAAHAAAGQGRALPKDLKIVSICRRLEGGLSAYFSFAVDMLRSMYHLATCKVCVLDSYWPAVSMLRHKDSLFVVQIWHALGKIKQSGYQTLAKDGGRDASAAKILDMHKNYDVIIAGGKAWNPFYCASFGVTEDVLRNTGLPRIDYLLHTEAAQREKIYRAHPVLREKKVILYAPTFRRYEVDGGRELLDHLDTENYVMILKAHPNQKLEYSGKGLYACDDFSAVELLSVCDFLITDYSAIAVEGAVLGRKTYYYVFDYEKYRETNGMNIDLFEAMPGCVFRRGDQLMEALQSGEYNRAALDRYRRRYLPENLGTSTEAIVKIIREQL